MLLKKSSKKFSKRTAAKLVPFSHILVIDNFFSHNSDHKRNQKLRWPPDSASFLFRRCSQCIPCSDDSGPPFSALLVNYDYSTAIWRRKIEMTSIRSPDKRIVFFIWSLSFRSAQRESSHSPISLASGRSSMSIQDGSMSFPYSQSHGTAGIWHWPVLRARKTCCRLFILCFTGHSDEWVCEKKRRRPVILY